jgi:hypothetical protein
LIILFSKVKVIAGGIAWLVGKSAWLMNIFTEWLDTIEFSNISGIQTNALEMVLLFALILAFTYAMLYKHYVSFLLSLGLVIFLLCSSLYSVYETGKQERILVYGFHDHMGVQFIKGRASQVLTDTLDDRSGQTISNYSTAAAVKKTTYINLQKGTYTFTYNGQKWCALIGDTLNAYDPELLSCDYFLISRNARIKGIETLDASRIIVDGSNDYKTLAYLKKLPAGLAEKLWIVKDKGAYIIE